jgi:hypothetical protein
MIRVPFDVKGEAMKQFSRKSMLWGILVFLGAGQLNVGWGNDPADSTSPEATAARGPRVSVEEARREAGLLHTAMHASLQLMHHRLYREDEGLPIPAAVVEEVFGELESEGNVKLRWLVVEGNAMNSDHIARDQFEEDAVAALKSGKTRYERIDAETYRYAGAIALTNACLKCHVPDRKSTENRTAGLVISIPISSN